MADAKRIYWRLRRLLLKKLVPEWVWPAAVMLDGVAIRVRNQPYSFGTKRLLCSGDYEIAERRLLAGLVKPGDTIIEMGGSIGVLTSILSHLTGATGKVISIEASRRLASISESWLREKGNVQVLNGFAFPVYNCRLKIVIESFDEDYGSLGAIAQFSYTEASVKRETVYDLNLICEQTGARPDILVVDVEGSEKIIIDERPAFPGSLKWIVIELHPQIYGQQTKKEILLRIQQENFELMKEDAEVYLFQKRM